MGYRGLVTGVVAVRRFYNSVTLVGKNPGLYGLKRASREVPFIELAAVNKTIDPSLVRGKRKGSAQTKTYSTNIVEGPGHSWNPGLFVDALWNGGQ